MSEKTDEEFITEIKNTIEKTTLSVSQKVNTSALSFMVKKGWVTAENKDDVVEFFNKKIPLVMTKELSQHLNKLLGLDLKL